MKKYQSSDNESANTKTIELNYTTGPHCIYCLNELQITNNPYKPGANYKCYDCKKTIQNVPSLHCFCK